MSLTNATQLADFGTGIGTQGAALTIDNDTKRLGVGTDTPNSTFQVGVGCSISSSGVITATTYYGDGSTLSGIETGVSIGAAGGANQPLVVCNTTAGVAILWRAVVVFIGMLVRVLYMLLMLIFQEQLLQRILKMLTPLEL